MREEEEEEHDDGFAIGCDGIKKLTDDPIPNITKTRRRAEVDVGEWRCKKFILVLLLGLSILYPQPPVLLR